MLVDPVNATVLFAGAGGSSLGLHDAGYDVEGYEYWLKAVDTHVANGMTCHLHDLSDPTLDDAIAPCDLLWASPPCQPFSAAGDGEGENDDRDGFPWALRIIGRLLPSVVIVKNVKGLTFDKHSDYFGGVLRALGDLGYDWQWKVLNSADYGVPQTRERCFIVARRDGGRIVWPAPTHTPGVSLFLEPWVTMAAALGWDGEYSYRRGEGMTERHGERGPWRMGDAPAPTVHRNTEKDLMVLRTNSGNGNAHDWEMDPATRPAPTLTERTSRWTLNYRQTNVNGEPITCDLTDRPSPTIGTQSQSQWQVWPHQRPATTIAGDTWVFQPGGHHEPGEQSQNAIRLTIAELALLQGFPADYQWTGTKTDQARQVGNAVPPIMAQVLADANRPVTQ
jgi:DNA (cytosine-5)-methyltransferase 1